MTGTEIPSGKLPLSRSSGVLSFDPRKKSPKPAASDTAPQTATETDPVDAAQLEAKQASLQIKHGTRAGRSGVVSSREKPATVKLAITKLLNQAFTLLDIKKEDQAAISTDKAQQTHLIKLSRDTHHLNEQLVEFGEEPIIVDGKLISSDITHKMALVKEKQEARDNDSKVALQTKLKWEFSTQNQNTHDPRNTKLKLLGIPTPDTLQDLTLEQLELLDTLPKKPMAEFTPNDEIAFITIQNNLNLELEPDTSSTETDPTQRQKDLKRIGNILLTVGAEVIEAANPSEVFQSMNKARKASKDRSHEETLAKQAAAFSDTFCSELGISPDDPDAGTIKTQLVESIKQLEKELKESKLDVGNNLLTLVAAAASSVPIANTALLSIVAVAGIPGLKGNISDSGKLGKLETTTHDTATSLKTSFEEALGNSDDKATLMQSFKDICDNEYGLSNNKKNKGIDLEEVKSFDESLDALDDKRPLAILRELMTYKAMEMTTRRQKEHAEQDALIGGADLAVAGTAIGVGAGTAGVGAIVIGAVYGTGRGILKLFMGRAKTRIRKEAQEMKDKLNKKGKPAKDITSTGVPAKYFYGLVEGAIKHNESESIPKLVRLTHNDQRTQLVRGTDANQTDMYKFMKTHHGNAIVAMNADNSLIPAKNNPWEVGRYT